MRLRIRVEDSDYDVDVEFLDDDSSSDLDRPAAKVRIPESVIRRRPAQKLPEDRFCRSPIAGRVTAVLAAAGKQVSKNEQVVLIEAMKMEIKVGPAVDGVIETIRVSPGETVRSGQVLFELS
jgi:biotin carboxyl carrier protein